MRKNRDVKFLIYQSLYIFVVCVIAIKGANLDLKAVIEDDGTPKAQISVDSLEKIYEIVKRSFIVDTNLFVIISKADLSKMDTRIQELVQRQQPTITASLNLTQPTVTNPIIQNNPPPIEQPEIKPEEKKDPGEMQEIRIGNIEFSQFTMNTLNNPYDVPLEIVGVTTIPPKSSKTFELGGQSTVTVKVGSSTKSISTKENRKPRIILQRVASMGEETRASQLNRTTGYRVSIEDDFPGQLNVSFSGPVTVKQAGNNVWDITMNLSKGSYDNLTENRDSPYSVGFTVNVTDKISGHKMAGQGSFSFGDW